jgi:hypothetical protein
VLPYLSLIPGSPPTFALTALTVAVVVLPAHTLGLAATVLIGPPYLIWRLAAHRHRH